MKKVLIGIVALIAVAVSAVLVVPSFIDWNAYKADFRTLVRETTGRDLNIDGDISITMLPTPALVAQDVRLGNIEGASAPDMVSLKSAEVRIKLGPLLGGHVVVESVRLIEPVVTLEVLADGRSNMTFVAGQAATATAPAAGGGEAEAGDTASEAPLSVSLESFVIQGGTLIYRDGATGRVERIDNLDASIAAASLDGPFETTGSAVVRGIPLGFDVTLGEIIHERTVPLTVSLESADSAARATINGALTNLAEVPKLKATLSVSGDNLAATLYDLAGLGSLPGGFAQSFAADGEVVAGSDRTELNDLSFRLGDMQGTAVGSLQLGDSTTLSAAVSATRFDLDHWLGLPPYQPPAGSRTAASVGVATADGKAANANLQPPVRAPRTTATTAAPFAIPNQIVGALDLNVGAVSYRGGLIRQLRASAEISNGEITVSQIAAQLPGSSEIALFGFVAAVNGQPQFDGEVEATISDLRSVADWLDVDMPPVPLDRLRKVTVKSKVAATPDEVRVSALDLRVDSSRVTGGVTIALRDRPAFGANLVLDRINLDSYMPGADAADAAGAAAASAPTGATSANTPAAAGNAMAAWQGLAAFDANIKARVAALTYQRTPMSEVTMDATLLNGSLDVRSASVGDIAGASLQVAGGIGPLTGLPVLKDVRIDLKAPETGRLFRMLDLTPPIPPEQLGAVTLSARLNGNVLAPDVDARLHAAGADVTVNGTLSPISTDTAIDADATLRHPDLARLLRTLGVDYRPAGNLGAIDLAAHVRGGPTAVALTSLAATVGGSDIKGDIALSLSGQRPRAEANLTTSELVIDRFLPAQRAAGLQPMPAPAYGLPGIVPAAWPAMPPPAAPSRVVPAATTAGERWSREPLDLALLGAFDGELTLNSAALIYDRYRLESADVTATLAGGIMRAEKIVGRLFGGSFTGGMELDATAVPRLNSSFSLKEASMGALMTALGAKGVSGGQLDTELTVTSSGRSVAEVVGALAGRGQVTATGIDVEAGAKGTPLSGLLGLIANINQVGGNHTGGRGDSHADVNGTYVIERGIARSDDIRLVSGLGNGQAAGTVDLPAWQIDMAGQIDLKQNLLAAYLTRNTSKVPTTLPFQVKGPLDAPNVRLETAALNGASIPIPGVDKLIEKNPAAGQLLQQILPGVTGQQPETQQQPSATEKPKTEDVIRGLLKGLSR